MLIYLIYLLINNSYNKIYSQLPISIYIYRYVFIFILELKMGMVFCRGCGKQIHDTAVACPSCGATQRATGQKTQMHGANSGRSGQNPFDYYGMVFKKYATFSGRASRGEFWWFTLINTIVTILLLILFLPLGLVYYWATFLPSVAVGVRRMHDTGRSGWFILIPIVSIVFWAEIGYSGDNEYGEDPVV